jgi:hypothetical protein
MHRDVLIADAILKLPRLVAITNPDNIASVKVVVTIGQRWCQMATLCCEPPGSAAISTLAPEEPRGEKEA